MGAWRDLKQSGWILQVTVLSVVLGVLLAASLKTQLNVRKISGIPTTRVSGLAQALLDEKDRCKVLQKEISDLRAKVDEYERVLGEGSTKTQVLSEELQKAKFLAGLNPTEGAGVEVVLRDSRKSPPSNAAELVGEYIIHDLDLRNFVNELLANGAEAIAICDEDSSQRVIARTPIRCVAGVIRVNDVPMSTPFVIKAIGPPHVMESALKMADGIIDQFRYIEGLNREMVQVRRKDNIFLPAYTGSTFFKYATLVEPEKKIK
jgi:uncharacterized protein YlxW (UPF0749 family)